MLNKGDIVKIVSCLVTENRKISEGVRILTCSAPEIAADAHSGQFVHVRVSDTIDPLLRRPFSLYGADPDTGEISILYRIKGKGTQLLGKADAGSRIDVLGPLGTGFPVQGEFDAALVIAGGMGVAPLFYLSEELANAGKKIDFIWGARTNTELWNRDRIESCAGTVRIATDDGSAGHRGTVCDLVARFILQKNHKTILRCFACGPDAMFSALQTLLKDTGIECYASFEETMACGIGVCQGCAVLMKNGSYKLACSDGPVFNLEEVEFNG